MEIARDVHDASEAFISRDEAEGSVAPCADIAQHVDRQAFQLLYANCWTPSKPHPSIRVSSEVSHAPDTDAQMLYCGVNGVRAYALGTSDADVAWARAGVEAEAEAFYTFWLRHILLSKTQEVFDLRKRVAFSYGKVARLKPVVKRLVHAKELVKYDAARRPRAPKTKQESRVMHTVADAADQESVAGGDVDGAMWYLWTFLHTSRSQKWKTRVASAFCIPHGTAPVTCVCDDGLMVAYMKRPGVCHAATMDVDGNITTRRDVSLDSDVVAVAMSGDVTLLASKTRVYANGTAVHHFALGDDERAEECNISAVSLPGGVGLEDYMCVGCTNGTYYVCTWRNDDAPLQAKGRTYADMPVIGITLTRSVLVVHSIHTIRTTLIEELTPVFTRDSIMDRVTGYAPRGTLVFSSDALTRGVTINNGMNKQTRTIVSGKSDNEAEKQRDEAAAAAAAACMKPAYNCIYVSPDTAFIAILEQTGHVKYIKTGMIV